MNRLQRNCVLASASIHGVLAGALVFGSAFLAPSRKAPDLDVLTVIPDLLVDAPISGGGNPNITQPAAPPPQPRPQPQPEPRPPEPVPQPQPQRSATPEPPEPADAPDLSQRPAEKHRPTVSRELTVRKSDSSSKSTRPDPDAEKRAADEERRRLRETLASAARNIGNVVSSSTSVEIPGPGGEAFASYAQIVKSKYTLAWIEPRDVQDDSAVVKASVTIRRDGTVEDARIIRPSGNAIVDASVRRTLEAVTFVAPFPVGAKDEKRVFTINFDLKAKRHFG